MGLACAPWSVRGFRGAPMGLDRAPWSGRGFRGAHPWGWPARHGAAVDFAGRLRSPCPAPWIQHPRTARFPGVRSAGPARAPRPGASASRPAPTGAMAGRQRQGGARADSPAVEAARDRGQEKTPRGRSPRGAVAGGKKEEAPEPEGSGAGGRRLRRQGPCRMPPGAAPAAGRRCPPRPACGRGSRCSRAGRPRSRSCSGRCRRGPATSGCAACR